MAVSLRLTRMGAKKKPFYRIVAADSRAPRDGRFIEKLGHYDPMTEPPVVKVDLERVDYWLGVGAKPSETVTQLIAKARSAADAPVEA
jgi:small subunit ribosomal protein S16